MAGENVILFPPRQASGVEVVALQRAELSVILSTYGRMVAHGLMRDYAIGSTRDHATFAMYTRTSERPAYVIEKRPRNVARQGAFSLIGQDGRILRRGHDLRQVLADLNRRLLKLAE